MGLRGLGECAPFPSLTYDDISSAKAAAAALLDQCIGLSVDAAIKLLDRHFKELSANSITGVVGVECALWDLRSQMLSQPLAQLFGNAGLKGLSTDITMPIMLPKNIAPFWQLYGPYGFKTIKVKISGNIASDSDMLAELVRVAPSATTYILDCNQGCSVSSTIEILEIAQRLGMKVIFCEQPLPERDLAGLGRLTRLTDVPICVDETVRSANDLTEILSLGLKPIVNIKIMKSGVAEALKIINVAISGGCPLMIGGMLESEIAMGFSLHIACGTGAFSYADLDTPFFFTNRLTGDSPWHKNSAQLSLPRGNGLGLALTPFAAYK
jgi:L-alanine-DL-glutamate epimerase-like enolase superfamily enzyme